MNKKAMVEALMRLIIAIVLVVIVLNIGKNIASAFFGGSDALQSFENLAKEINTFRDESKQTLLYMDEGTAVIGFSKNMKEFRCYGCPQTFSPTPFYYSIQKPSNENCNDKPCVCICLKGFRSSPILGSESKINCDSFSCQALNEDIAPKISLEESLKKRNVQLASYPYWENGFFFVRRKDSETPLNGMPPNDIRKITLWIEKKNVGNNNYVAVCPVSPCIPEQKNFVPGGGASGGGV